MMYEINNDIVAFEPLVDIYNTSELLEQLGKYKTFYDKQMNHIQNWKDRNIEKVNCYHKEYYHSHLKNNVKFIEKMQSQERKAIVKKSYEKNKEKYKQQKLERCGQPNAKGRPRKNVSEIIGVKEML